MKPSPSLEKQLDSLPPRAASFIEPMECVAVSKLHDGPQWIYEIKLDGYRALGIKSDRGVRLLSRRNNPFNRQYPLIVEALSELPEETVVDGEVVALNQSGIPNFNLLQNYRSEASRIHFFIFDLLIYKGHDLTRLPLIERREELPDEQVASSRRTTPPSTASVGRIVLFLGTRRRKVTGRNSRRLPPHFVNDKIHRQCS